MTASALSPKLLTPRAGMSYMLGRDLVTFKATGDDTGGAYTLFAGRTAPGDGSPPHIHHLEDEAFLVLEGTFSFTVGEQTAEYGPGGFVFVPRGISRAFQNTGTAPGWLLVVVTPGGLHEQFFAEFGEPVADPSADLPPTRPDFARLMAAGARYGLEFIRPTAGGA